MSENVGQDIREDQFDGVSRYSWQLYTGPRYDVPPKLLKVESYVETCASCHAWVERYPQWLGEMDKSWQCEKCGNSSVDIRVGRPYGPKSKDWTWIENLFYELWSSMEPYDYIGLHTYPPLDAVDDEYFEDAFDVPEDEDTEPDIPFGTPCPHCQSTMTDDVAVIWQDEHLRCDAHVCYWCGETFETVTGLETDGPDAELDALEGGE